MSADPSNVSAGKSVTSCSASTTFNFTVGAIAIAVAGVIGYFLYNWLVAS
jgi:hypothetical protein